MVKIPFSKLIAIIWGIILAFFIAKKLIDVAIELADYFGFAASDVISADLAGRIAVLFGIPGNVSIAYKLPKNIIYRLNLSEKTVCVESGGLVNIIYHCKNTLFDLPEEYFFEKAGIELFINKAAIDGKYTVSVKG